MLDQSKPLENILAAWNESDPQKVRDLLEQSLSPEIRFVDPTIDLVGIDAFQKNIEEFQAKLPGAVTSITSKIDSQHEFQRYHWAIHQGGSLVISGFDVTQVDSSGKIKAVIGFFGDLSPSE